MRVDVRAVGAAALGRPRARFRRSRLLGEDASVVCERRARRLYFYKRNRVVTMTSPRPSRSSRNRAIQPAIVAGLAPHASRKKGSHRGGRTGADHSLRRHHESLQTCARTPFLSPLSSACVSEPRLCDRRSSRDAIHLLCSSSQRVAIAYASRSHTRSSRSSCCSRRLRASGFIGRTPPRYVRRDTRPSKDFRNYDAKGNKRGNRGCI